MFPFKSESTALSDPDPQPLLCTESAGYRENKISIRFALLFTVCIALLFTVQGVSHYFACQRCFCFPEKFNRTF